MAGHEGNLRQVSNWVISNAFRWSKNGRKSTFVFCLSAVWLRHSLRWLIYIIDSWWNQNYLVILPHQRTTTVSQETYPLYSIFELVEWEIFLILCRNPEWEQIKSNTIFSILAKDSHLFAQEYVYIHVHHVSLKYSRHPSGKSVRHYLFSFVSHLVPPSFANQSWNYFQLRAGIRLPLTFTVNSFFRY